MIKTLVREVLDQHIRKEINPVMGAECHVKSFTDTGRSHALICPCKLVSLVPRVMKSHIMDKVSEISRLGSIPRISAILFTPMKNRIEIPYNHIWSIESITNFMKLS
ncbi:unnamed protein product [Linum trigynum]|uniref:Uncharacterized protein n=1 Tax=Linum trigynum TaxID=586398 RepID=A0AAV2DWR0_9ROSI